MRPAIALALITLIGCTDLPDFTEPPAPGGVTYPVPGTYALATINGAPLPAEFPLDVRITSSRLTVLAAGTWSETRSAMVAGEVKNLGWAGTWTRFENSDVTLRVGATLFYVGVPTSSALTLAHGGSVFVYSRE